MEAGSAAQGAPLACANCGADFRTFPDELDSLGISKVLRLDMLAVRPDIFDPGGMARYIRGFLGAQTGLPEYVLSAAKIKVQAQIQGEQVRVSGKKRDDLQAVIALLKNVDFGLPLQFINFRD